jgi:two-component system, OmpR family, alkaline phosphatase synthesis response regulator PhoP
MKKILVIEDEASVRTNILEILESGGFEVILAEDGKVGLQLAKEQIPDLIICDIMMPGLDGYGVLTTLLEQPTTAMIPFIFLTAKTTREDFRQGMNLGADDYITKPFRRTELLEAVKVRLEKQTTLAQQYTAQYKRARDLQQKVQDLQLLSNTQDKLLKQLIENLRSPLTNINMAIELLKTTPAGTKRDRYLEILQEEFAQEIQFLNQLSDLQELLTPENVKLLRQFNLLKNGSS